MCANNVALPAFHPLHAAAAARLAPIDRYLLPAGPTAANLQLQRICFYGPMLGQTDGRTPYHCIGGTDRHPQTMRAVPKRTWSE